MKDLKQKSAPMLFAISAFPAALLAGLIAIVSESAHGVLLGGVSDGGGSAVVCRDAKKNVVSAEVLDLWEARVLLGKQIITSLDPSLDHTQLAKHFASKIDIGGAAVSLTSSTVVRGPDGTINRQYLSFWGGDVPSDFVGSGVEYLPSVTRMLPVGTTLKVVEDYQSPVLPRDCEVEQLAVFQDKFNRLLVVEEIWNALDRESRAALLVHESLYRALRARGETNSDRTRMAVGLAFAGHTFEWVYDYMPQSVMLCGSNDAEQSLQFAVFDDGVDTNVQVFRTGGKHLLTRESLIWPKDSSPLVSPAMLQYPSTFAKAFSSDMHEGEALFITVAPNADKTELNVVAGTVGSPGLSMTCVGASRPNWNRKF